MLLELGETNVSQVSDVSRSAQNQAANRQTQPETTSRTPQNQTVASARTAEQSRNQPAVENEAPARRDTVSEGEVSMQVREINTHLLSRNLALNYQRHEGTNQYFLTIYNRDTHEVVREIPPERSLDMLARIWEMTGIFISERG